ncbi:hypothetical protein [Magnetospirillum sp. SS-4]|uniref:hypothetical protein n=1 Tax=Magnetospirillum sp. SS-4 TaxID=2681465 RepID=UPI001386571D|nr:hypothetical protein [Magnetospirillum sp. SS-4]CAA7617074.1 conserved hypothetical protein [Magnetospirillum sp. SS-4]
MQVTTVGTSHLLLNRKDDPASHDTRPARTGPASAFATHAFGPMDLPDKNKATTIDGTRQGGAGGNTSVSAATSSSIGWLTHLAVSQGMK